MISPSRFDHVLESGHEVYLSSSTGKARKALASIPKLTARVNACAVDLGVALTRGDGSKAARNALFDAEIDLRLACSEADACVRLAEAEASLKAETVAVKCVGRAA